MHTHRQHDGNHGRQALRYGGNGGRHGQQEYFQPVQTLEQTNRYQQGTYAEEKNNYVPAQLADVFLQGRFLRLDFLDGGGYLADVRRHAGPDDHGGGATVIDNGTHVHHVLSLRHGYVFTDGIGVFVNGHGLTGEHGLVDFQVGDLNKPGVGRDFITGFQEHDVAGNNLSGGDNLYSPITPDTGLGCRHLDECLHRFLGAGLLCKADGGIEKKHAENHTGVNKVLNNEGDNGGDHQDVNERAEKLPQEYDYRRRLLLALQLVRAVPHTARTGLITGKPGTTGTKCLQSFTGGEVVPLRVHAR